MKTKNKPKRKLSEKRTSISDKAMLDWCESHAATGFDRCGNAGWRIYTGPITDTLYGEGPTLRRAIYDAMMKEAK